ncbi:MAG: glycosyltransferase [Cyclobacteriaceae bacterium]|nr:glycosyltransferase [Cyclobacteriaceae bacterium]
MKILMLGWEFPPLFTGGLGVATYGIVKSLNQYSQIRLIIPTAGDASDLEDVNIIGLNKLTKEEIDIESIQFEIEFDNTRVEKIPLQISPYHFTNASFSGFFGSNDHPESDQKIDVIRSIFSGRDMYGFNVMHKVHLFALLSAEIASDGDFDIIHAHDWVTYPAAVRIKKQSGKPLVVHVHALETDRVGDTVRNDIYWMERDGLLEADSIVAVSEYTKEQIVKHYEIDPSKISVVHNGIEPIPVKRSVHKLKDKLVIFLGRITSQKGPNFLLETAEKVVRVYPRVKFVVAGTGDQFGHLLESTAYRKLGSKFIFTGFLSKTKVNELLSMADAYFMPSVSEPFGLTALEAAHHKVPAVISSQSGAAEVMKGSLQADFWDTDKYANYIHAILKYPALGKILSDRAALELNDLTWDHAAKKLRNVYDTLLQES